MSTQTDNGEGVVVNLTRAHLVFSLCLLIGGVIVWPTVFYVRVNAAIVQLAEADQMHNASIQRHQERLDILDRTGSVGTTNKIEAVRVALLSNVDKTSDHEARVRVLEKTINDMAADVRWLVLQQKNK
jgi:cell division protein FtsI/penicillin-binding protein 2